MSTTYNTFRKLCPEHLEATGGNACAALLLDLFAYWTNARESNNAQAKSGGKEGNDLWFYRTLSDIHKDLYGAFGRAAIRSALQLLHDRGLIESRTNPQSPWDRTLQYRTLHSSISDDVHGAESNDDAGARPSRPSDARTIEEETRGEARERAQTPTGYSFNGHRVKAEDGQKACSVLAVFNELAGATLKPFLASGASPELKRVTRAVLDHPDLSADEWRAVIRWTLEHPWWSGAVTIGAVFGPNAVGENIDKWRRRAENGARPLAIVPPPQQPVRHDRYSDKRQREIEREEAAQRVLVARQREDQQP